MRPRSLLFDISRPLISVRHHQYSITLLVCATWAFYMSVWLDIGRGYRSAADFYVYTVRLSTESTRAHGERASWIPSKRRNALLARPLSHRALSLSLTERLYTCEWPPFWNETVINRIVYREEGWVIRFTRSLGLNLPIIQIVDGRDISIPAAVPKSEKE